MAYTDKKVRVVAGPKVYESGRVAGVPQEQNPPRAKTRPVTQMTLWSNHLDGTDEHRCQTCYIAFPEGSPLCKAGQVLYDASH